MTEAKPRGKEQLVINMQGEKVALGPMSSELVPAMHRWINHFDTARLAGFVPKPITLDQETGRVERWANDEHDALFVIYEVGTWRPIGFTGLRGIDLHNRTAEFGITIGEPDCRGKGYGTETTMLVLDYAFTARGLYSVYLTTAEFNVAGERAYKKAGFKEFGRQRQCEMMGGRMWDLIYMDCLASEFISPVLAREFGLAEGEQ
jgi:diamine N-acetyltransferase